MNQNHLRLISSLRIYELFVIWQNYILVYGQNLNYEVFILNNSIIFFNPLKHSYENRIHLKMTLDIIISVFNYNM
jgi:hypothetical protein